EIRLKQQRQKKADRELKKNAEERKKKRVDQSPPENWIRESCAVLSQPVERHFSTDKRLNCGFPEAERQAVDDRIKQEDQAKNDEWQDKQVRRRGYQELSCLHRRIESVHFPLNPSFDRAARDAGHDESAGKNYEEESRNRGENASGQ